MPLEIVLIDPDAMIAIERLVFSRRQWSAARVCRRSKQGIVRDSKLGTERRMAVRMRALRGFRGCDFVADCLTSRYSAPRNSAAMTH
jgi:hypothetical protein